ncbi:MAG: metallophosphoesterase [Candidatus Omnitrophota bacterium]|nr:metallophosphoesterase [Candidatus Omnitrophota bacterium]
MHVRVRVAIVVFCIVFLCVHGQAFARDQCVAIYGDSRTNHNTHRALLSAILATNPIAIFHTGDIVTNEYDQRDWKAFRDIISTRSASIPFYPARGNHERNSPFYGNSVSISGDRPFYSVTIGRAHFIVLDSASGMRARSGQYRWLKAELAQARKNSKFIIVIMHHPLVSTGKHPQDEMKLGSLLFPLFKAYGVHIVFAGHDHTYERSLYQGIYYVTTGGGGAPLYASSRASPYSQRYMPVHHFCQVCISETGISLAVIDDKERVIDALVLPEKKMPQTP